MYCKIVKSICYNNAGKSKYGSLRSIGSRGDRLLQFEIGFAARMLGLGRSQECRRCIFLWRHPPVLIVTEKPAISKRTVHQPEIMALILRTNPAGSSGRAPSASTA